MVNTGGEESHQAKDGVLLGLDRLWEAAEGYLQAKQNMYSAGGMLLISTQDIVECYKEFFEDLFNPTDTSSVEEADSLNIKGYHPRA